MQFVYKRNYFLVYYPSHLTIFILSSYFRMFILFYLFISIIFEDYGYFLAPYSITLLPIFKYVQNISKTLITISRYSR